MTKDELRSLDLNDLMVKLAEECGEATQAACKIYRFGSYNYDPNSKTPNNVALLRELNEIVTITLVLCGRYGISYNDLRDGNV